MRAKTRSREEGFQTKTKLPPLILYYAKQPCLVGSAKTSRSIHKMDPEAHVKGLLRFVFMIVVVFQCIQVKVASAVACTFVLGSKCKCTLADGSGEIDLSPLFAVGMLSVQR